MNFNEYLYYEWIFEQIKGEIKSGGMTRWMDEWES